MKRTVLVVLGVVLLCGCGYMPSERAIYKQARKAIEQDANIPENAKPKSIRHAKFYIGKNAGRIDLHYEYTDADGNAQTGVYPVWVKRIARTWKFDRVEPSFRL